MNKNIKIGATILALFAAGNVKLPQTEVTGSTSNIQTVSTLNSTIESTHDVSIYPEAITYNEQAVVSIDIPENVSIAEGFIDATEIGGASDISVDLELFEHTVSVHESVTTGMKNLEVTLIDESGMKYTEEITLEVLPREIKHTVDFDWDEAVIYFLLTDRFYDGDPTNNNPNGEDYDTSHSESYHGGDLQGIIDRIDYLEDLGINTIWISPIIDNVDHDHRHGKDGSQYGYHGYWAKDFTSIDEHIGDLDTFKTLIDEAHDRGIKIMVDVILNHTGYGMKTTDSGSGISNFPTVDEQEVFSGMLREDPLAGHDILGEIYGLPDFKTEEQAVREQVIQWQTDWIERARTNQGNTIDYFRVDTVKHVEDTTWNAFRNELTKIKPDFKMIGEHFGGSYNNTGGYLNSGQMDSLLDFDFKRLASSYAHGSIERTEVELQKRNEALDHTATVGHFLSSHDEDGFLYYFMQGDEDLFKVAISLQLTAKGQPVIYYGEEIGLSGKAEGDMNQGEFSENRYDFDWELAEDHHLVDHYKKVLVSRKNHSKVLAKGDRVHLAGTDDEGYSVFSRTHEEDTIYVGLNTTDEIVSTSVDVSEVSDMNLKDEYNDIVYEVTTDQTIHIQIPAYSDGGTAILAATNVEAENDETKAYLFIGAGVLLVGYGGYSIWKSKKEN